MLSKHPFDWLIHFSLCFAAVFFNQATIIATIFVSVMIEYEQWSYAGKPDLKSYFVPNVLGDLIADFVGIGLALFLTC